MIGRRALFGAALVALAAVGCNQVSAPPIELSYRESLVGAGKVVQIENTSNEALLGLAVEIIAPEGETRTFTLDELAGYGSIEIGWKKLGGWQIPEGADVKVSAEGFFLPFEGKLATEVSN